MRTYVRPIARAIDLAIEVLPTPGGPENSRMRPLCALPDRVLQDDVLARLLTFPNVLITAHQGFLTREALDNIATTTLDNARAFERGGPLRNKVRASEVLRPPKP
jgi:hypothetical protein